MDIVFAPLGKPRKSLASAATVQMSEENLYLRGPVGGRKENVVTLRPQRSWRIGLRGPYDFDRRARLSERDPRKRRKGCDQNIPNAAPAQVLHLGPEAA